MRKRRRRRRRKRKRKRRKRKKRKRKRRIRERKVRTYHHGILLGARGPNVSPVHISDPKLLLHITKWFEINDLLHMNPNILIFSILLCINRTTS